MPPPWSETVTSSAPPSSARKNSTLPPEAYSKALRASSETAVAMRTWSCRSKPRPSAMRRARWRERTTSRS
jgi:hypothetical protein